MYSEHNTIYNKSSAVAEMGDRGHNIHEPSAWHLNPASRLATIDMGQKLGEVAAPLLRGRAGSPSNTTSPEPRPTSIPIGILVHRAIVTCGVSLSNAAHASQSAQSNTPGPSQSGTSH